MTQYIDKDRIVAELKRRIQESLDKGGATSGVYLSERMKEDSYILSLLDTPQQEQANVEHDIAEKFARIVRGHLHELTAGFNMEFERAYFEVTGEKMYKGYSD